MSISDTWNRFKTDGFGGDSSKEAVSPAVPLQSSTTNYTMPASAGSLSEAFKAAVIQEVVDRVPKLKQILETANDMADIEPDLSKRIRLTLRTLKVGATDLSILKSDISSAVDIAANKIRDEYAAEEREKITSPMQSLQQLKSSKIAKEAELAELSSQIGVSELAIASARQEIQSTKQKSDAGVSLIIEWQNQLTALLN
jgi:hypothetical protein